MKILLVDDDAAIVQSLLAVLEQLPGNDVRGATTGGQALQTAMSMGGIDLLITDVVMDPMDGFTLRDQMTTRYPNCRTIFITGYDLSDYAEQTANHQVLAKPVEQAELIGAVARELMPSAPAESAAVAAAPPEAAAPEPVAEVAAAPTEAAPEKEAPAEPIIPADVPAAPAPAPEPVAATAEPVTPVPAPAPTPEPAAPVAVAATAVPAPVTAKAVPAAAKAVAVPVAVPKVAVATPVAATAVKAVAGGSGVRPVSAVPAQPVKAGGPTAVPKVAPTVAVPKATAAPASPTVPTPTAKAAPTVKAVAAAQPVAAPKPVAAAKAVSAPKAVAAVKPVAAPAVKAAAPTPVPEPPVHDEMVGKTVGTYEIQRVIGQGPWGRVYAALQTSINRVVGLNLLAPEQASDESTRARFLGDARAKAHVQHPSILAVYEAGEANDQVFYTHEYVDGRTLAQIERAGEKIDETTALQVLKVTSDGLNYLTTQQISHPSPQPADIYVGTDGAVRLANLATNEEARQTRADQEIQSLGRLVLGLLPAIQTLSPGLRTLLSRMVQAGPQGINSWAALQQGIKALEPKVVPLEAAKISAQDRAATAAMEAARREQKRSLYITVASMVSLAVLAAVAVWWFFSSNQRSLDEQIHIPAGSFVFGSGGKAETGEFWIDKYEVSIGQYAEFVKHLEDHPTSEYDHPKQPRIKTAEMHKPRDWAIYYGRAQAGKPIHGVPSDLNMPALMVDWWDAYAYAKWKGRELPTEQEWEKAARGTEGFIYPWGNEMDQKRVNSNADFVLTDPAAPGKIDGFNHWGPVDKQRDKGPFGTVGMAGNVAEWTATWTKDEKFPIIKGGSYMSNDVRLDKRTADVPPQTAQENLGFRTISRKPPEK